MKITTPTSCACKLTAIVSGKGSLVINKGKVARRASSVSGLMMLYLHNDVFLFYILKELRRRGNPTCEPGNALGKDRLLLKHLLYPRFQCKDNSTYEVPTIVCGFSPIR